MPIDVMVVQNCYIEYSEDMLGFWDFSPYTLRYWDAVPAWVGQARFLRTLTYESLTKRVRHADVQRARRNILKPISRGNKY
jgi:hypothetical protein